MEGHCPKFSTALYTKHPHNPKGKKKFKWKYMHIIMIFTPPNASTLFNNQSAHNPKHSNSRGCHHGLGVNKKWSWFSHHPIHQHSNNQRAHNPKHTNSKGCHHGLGGNQWKFQNSHEKQHNFQWQYTGTEQTHVRNSSPEQKKRPIRKIRHWKFLTPITQNLCPNQAPASFMSVSPPLTNTPTPNLPITIYSFRKLSCGVFNSQPKEASKVLKYERCCPLSFCFFDWKNPDFLLGWRGRDNKRREYEETWERRMGVGRCTPL